MIQTCIFFTSGLQQVPLFLPFKFALHSRPVGVKLEAPCGPSNPGFYSSLIFIYFLFELCPTQHLTPATPRMATNRPTEALPSGKSNGAARDDVEDFQPSAREALHTDPELCRKTLDRVTSSVPLAIRFSNISMGSGLFVTADIDAGQEIYHVDPMMEAVDAGNDSYCHYCLEDTQDALGGESKATSQAKACTACKVARFCSKVCGEDW
jgi:hypothetical protein